MNLAPLIGFTIGAALLAVGTVLAFLWAPSNPGPMDEDEPTGYDGFGAPLYENRD
jgi:hypothetical protein